MNKNTYNFYKLYNKKSNLTVNNMKVYENNNMIKQENNSSSVETNFFDTFIQTCVLAQWRYQIIARKHRKKNTRKPTKKDIFFSNTKKLFNSISNIIAEHKANYLYDLCDIMIQMPLKPGIKHIKDFGTIKIVNNKALNIKSMKRIKFLSKLYFIIKINNDLEDILIESINKMNENRNKRL